MKEMNKKMASQNIDLAEYGRLLASIKSKSQSAQIKTSISGQIHRLKAKEKLDEIAGIWSARTDIPDIRNMRTGWRPAKKQG
jgi:hypothetical protein